jgi:hypothetical protein
MRGKKAKALRRAARKASVGMPERGYATLASTRNRTIVNHPNTERGIYRRMKAA